MVTIHSTDNGKITQVKVFDKIYSIGDDTKLSGEITEFFTNGDVIWAGFKNGQQFKARLLLNPTTKK